MKGDFSCVFIKGAYWIRSNSSFTQYCDSNIGPFSIAPPFSYRSSKFAITNLQNLYKKWSKGMSDNFAIAKLEER